MVVCILLKNIDFVLLVKIKIIDLVYREQINTIYEYCTA